MRRGLIALMALLALIFSAEESGLWKTGGLIALIALLALNFLKKVCVPIAGVGAIHHDSDNT
jgi:hypothetical protein